MRIFYIILATIIGFILMCEIIKLIHDVSLFYIEKRNNIAFKNNMIANEINNTGTRLSIGDRVEITASFLNLIDTLIDLDISSKLIYNARLKEEYKTFNLDKDIEEISARVFEAIKSGSFTNKDLLLSDDYCLDYINKRTTTKLISATVTYNNNLNHPEEASPIEGKPS